MEDQQPIAPQRSVYMLEFILWMRKLPPCTFRLGTRSWLLLALKQTKTKRQRQTSNNMRNRIRGKTQGKVGPCYGSFNLCIVRVRARSNDSVSIYQNLTHVNDLWAADINPLGGADRARSSEWNHRSASLKGASRGGLGDWW